MLTPEQRAAAMTEGWLVETVVDNGKTSPYYMVVRYGPRFDNDRDAGAHVVARARTGSRFHLSVLQGVMASRVAQPTRKKR